MNKSLGGIFSVAGLIGVIFFGYQYLQDSETFSAFGADVVVTTGDITPVLISAVVMLVGVAMSVRTLSVTT